MTITDLMFYLVSISIEYYKYFRPKISITYDDDLYQYIQNVILRRYYSKYDTSEVIKSITMFNSHFDMEYILNNDHAYMNDLLNVIYLDMDEYLSTLPNISPSDIVLELNSDACPFDSLTIRHAFILESFDMYFY